MKKLLPSMATSAITSAVVFLIFWGITPWLFTPATQQESANPKNQPTLLQPTVPPVSAAAQTYEDTIVNAVKKSSPAVVSIVISKDMPVIERYFEQRQNDSFEDFFSMPMPQYRQNGTQKQDIGGGSGFIVSSDGYIITNKHVVNEEDADYTVFTSDNQKHEAKVIARDPLNDLAVLKIESENLPYLDFGDSEAAEVGRTAIAIGFPLLEFKNSVSVGVISGISRSIIASDRAFGQSEQLDNVIQTDAAINPGNSGGPLLNIQGQVIGVNVAVANGENIAFSIPGNLAKKVFESVKATGKIIRPYLGLRYIPITKELKEKNKLDVDYGALVLRGDTKEDLAIIPGSPADKAGIVENDIILEIDGQRLDEKTSLRGLIANKEVGDEITLKTLHKGEEHSIKVKLEEMKE